MALLNTYQIAANTTPQALGVLGSRGQRTLRLSVTGANNLLIGNSTVNSTTGFPVKANNNFDTVISVNANTYIITTSGTGAVSVLETVG